MGGNAITSVRPSSVCFHSSEYTDRWAYWHLTVQLCKQSFLSQSLVGPQTTSDPAKWRICLPEGLYHGRKKLTQTWNEVITSLEWLLDVPRWTSASSLFVLRVQCQHLLLLFASLLSVWLYYIHNSSNSLLIAYIYMESDMYYRSKVLHKWRRLLYTCMD